MVLKLDEICLNYITNNFYSIQAFDCTLLHTIHKEKIIERLANHNLLQANGKFNLIVANDQLKYQRSIVNYFFNGNLNYFKFNCCQDLNDSFLKLIAYNSRKLIVKSLILNKCNQVSGNFIKYFVYLHFSFVLFYSFKLKITFSIIFFTIKK